MSLRLHMLQVARLAPAILEDATPLVRAFISRQLTHGLAPDRAGAPDLYYTVFALACREALLSPFGHGQGTQVADDYDVRPLISQLKTFGDGEHLDFVHRGALGRCWAFARSMEPGCMPDGLAKSLALGMEDFRARDGGYDVDRNAPHGNAYGCFVALGAYQDLGVPHPDPLRLVQCLKRLETPDGAWSNLPGMPRGATNATAAAVVLLHALGMPLNSQVAEWLSTQIHPEGGFLAVPGAPMPDLLSTATALHALACLEAPLPQKKRERCLDFIDTLWSAEGGFHGNWADDHLDAEYTFYGLLALGHLR